MKNIKNIKIYLIISVIFIITSSIVFFLLSKKADKKQEVLISVKDYILSGFLAELPEINNILPHKIDKNTELLSIKYENNIILSNYRLTANGISREFLEKITPSIQKEVCSDEIKRKLIDVDIDFLNRYQSSSGDLKFEIPINKSICSKFLKSANK